MFELVIYIYIYIQVYGLRSITIMGDGTVVSASNNGGAGFEAGFLVNARPEVALDVAKAHGADLNQVDIVVTHARRTDDDNGSDDGEHGLLLTGSHVKKDVDEAGRAMVKGEWATGRVLQLLNSQFMPQGVQITDVMITNVGLPEEIVTKMYSKTMVISGNAQEIMTQQFDMQEVCKFIAVCKCNVDTETPSRN
jgi:hypothetical protein